MNARNLAMCFAPSLFDTAGASRYKVKSSLGGGGRAGVGRTCRPARRGHDQGQGGQGGGLITDKDLERHHAEHDCLAAMITNAKDLFTVCHHYSS